MIDDESGQPERTYNSYLDFYSDAYGDFLVEKKLFEGRELVGMFMAQQPAGHFPDNPNEEYAIQMLTSSSVRTKIDLGAGEFEGTMRRGSFVFSPPQTSTEYELGQQHSLLMLGVPKSYFRAALLDAQCEEFPLEAMLYGNHSDKVIEELMLESWREAERGGDLGALYVDQNLMMIASRIVALANRAKAAPTREATKQLDRKVIALITDYVDSNVDTAIRMKTRANIARMNEFEFSRAFKATTDMPPYQWVIERRIAKAQSMLTGSDLPIADIAYACGFSGQAHMTSLFSKRLARTPLEVRQASR